jgi:hypothetical protein
MAQETLFEQDGYSVTQHKSNGLYTISDGKYTFSTFTIPDPITVKALREEVLDYIRNWHEHVEDNHSLSNQEHEHGLHDYF